MGDHDPNILEIPGLPHTIWEEVVQSSKRSPMVCESMCEIVRLDCLGPSPKGGGEVEGESPAKRRERRGTALESTMTQKIAKTLYLRQP